MDYDAPLQELYGLERLGIKLGLDTITDLLGHMGNPQRRFKTVHVTGTAAWIRFAGCTCNRGKVRSAA